MLVSTWGLNSARCFPARPVNLESGWRRHASFEVCSWWNRDCEATGLAVLGLGWQTALTPPPSRTKIRGMTMAVGTADAGNASSGDALPLLL